MAIILVTHDLGVVAETCDRLAVMYCGRIVESGPVSAVFKAPRHPYTHGLLHSRPRVDHRKEALLPIKGVVPTPAELPIGCAFAPRCNSRREVCQSRVPQLTVNPMGRGHACFYPLADPLEG
jgi:oligopeptide/dipeptide ABC transporter ATP-binding protein